MRIIIIFLSILQFKIIEYKCVFLKKVLTKITYRVIINVKISRFINAVKSRGAPLLRKKIYAKDSLVRFKR